MSDNSKKANAAPRCQYVRLNEQRCTQPALKDHSFCRFHELVDRPLPDTRLIPFVEDATTLQLALMQVIRSLQRGEITRPVAGTILYALQIAAQNLKHFSEEFGHPFVQPAARKTAKELKEEEARKGPSLAEYVIQSLGLISPEEKAQQEAREVRQASALAHPPAVILSEAAAAAESQDLVFPPRPTASPAVNEVVKEEAKPQPGIIDRLEASDGSALGISPTLADFPWDAWENRVAAGSYLYVARGRLRPLPAAIWSRLPRPRSAARAGRFAQPCAQLDADGGSLR